MPAVTNPFTAGTWVVEAKPQNVWGIPHASWFFAMGIGGALFINRVLFGIELGRIFGIALADLLSLLLIAAGGLVLIADLGKPLRVLRALMNPRTSWISIGAISDIVFLVVEGLWIAADIEFGGARPLAWLPWAGNSPLGIAFQSVAAVSAFIVILYPGLVLAYSPAIPFWNTTLIPLQFLTFGFASSVGLALLFTLWVPVSTEMLMTLLTAELCLLAASALFFLAHMANRSSHTTARLSVRRLLQGELRTAFLLGTVLVGLILPALFAIFGLIQGGAAPQAIMLISVAVLVGNWFSKYAVIKAGIYAPYF